MDWVCFDHKHVHGFVRLEAAAVEIDIGVWRVILAIGSEGGVVRQLGVVGLGSAAGSQIKYLRVERFVQLLRKVGRFTQGAFVGCR